MNKIKFIVYAAVLLDVLSIGIFIPISEVLVNRYQVSPFWITLGLSIYSLSSFISTPVLGQLSDKYGRKNLLLLCVFGTAVSYLVLLFTHNYWIFIISRIINGITGGNFAILQSIISDISKDENDRKKNLGLMGGIFGLGFIIGPILGSLGLTFGGANGVFWLGGIFGILDLIGIYFLLPETHTNRLSLQNNKIEYLGFKTLYKYLLDKNISIYLRSMMLLGIGFFAHFGAMALQVKQTYGVGGETFGYVMAIFGVISVINLAVLIPKFRVPKFTSKNIIYIAHIGSFLMIIGMRFMTANKNIYIFGIYGYYIYLMFVGLVSIFNIYQPIYQSEIISHSDKNKIGEISGVTTSVQNIGMILGPLLGGILLDANINVYIGGLVFVIASALLVGVYRKSF